MTTKLKEVDVVLVGLGWTGGILAKELTAVRMPMAAVLGNHDQRVDRNAHHDARKNQRQHGHVI